MSLGIHVAKTSKVCGSKYASMYDAIKEETEMLKLDACQIFTHGPRTYNRNHIEYEKIRRYCAESKIDISVHGSYLSVGIWKIKKNNKHITSSKKLMAHLIDTLASTKALGGGSVIIHLPNKPPNIIVETLEVLSENKEIEALQMNRGPFIILEMPASKPDENTYESADKLNNLCSMICSASDKGKKTITLKWGLCIDTSHQYSCGINFGDQIIFRDWLGYLTDFTRHKIKIIHLNGNSEKNFKKGKDVHEIIMSPDDGIWHHVLSSRIKNSIKKKINSTVDDDYNFYTELKEIEIENLHRSSLYDLIEFAKRGDMVIILEINRGEYAYIKFAVDIIDGILANIVE